MTWSGEELLRYERLLNLARSIDEQCPWYQIVTYDDDIDEDIDLLAQDLAKLSSDALMSYLHEQMTSSEFPWEKVQKAIYEIEDSDAIRAIGELDSVANASMFFHCLSSYRQAWESYMTQPEDVLNLCRVTQISEVMLLFKILRARVQVDSCKPNCAE